MHLDALLQQYHGVLRAGDVSSQALRRWCRGGRLRNVVPGWYTAPGAGAELLVRAIQGWDPDATILGRAAARLTFWPELEVDRIHVSTRRRPRTAPDIVTYVREIPAELRILGFTTPAATAVDLAAHDNGEAITEVLRRRAARPQDLVEALDLMPHRPGNRRRRELVEASTRNPWSVAERRLHEILTRADLPVWEGNARIRIGRQTLFGDVVFRDHRVVIEVDGWAVHGNRRAFQQDRRRQNLLTLHGWRVIRFTWDDLDDPAHVLGVVRSMLVAAA